MAELTSFEKMGVLGIALAIMFFGFRVFQLFVEQWRQSTAAQDRSTEALNRNTDSFEKLAAVFEKQAERDIEFQKSVTQVLNRNTSILNSTHRKVTELHGVVVLRRREDVEKPSEEGLVGGDMSDDEAYRA